MSQSLHVWMVFGSCLLIPAFPPPAMGACGAEGEARLVKLETSVQPPLVQQVRNLHHKVSGLAVM
eukprot:5684092-Amphidinium_carterae.2